MASRADIRAGRAYVELSVRRSGFDRGLRAAQGQLRAFSTGIQTIGGELLRFGLTAGGVFGGFVGAAIGPINAANTLAKNIQRFESIFGDSSVAMRKWARDWVDAIGRAEGDTLASLSTFGGFFKGLKVGSQEAGEMSKQMHALAMDFGTFNNLSDVEAIDRFISALSGSSEVLDRFGINIKVAALDQALVARGFETSAKGATELQKVIARMDIIRATLGSQGAIGNAAKAAQGYSGRVSALNSRMGDLAEAIGGALLPPVTELVTVMERATNAAAAWVGENPAMILGAGKIAAAIGLSGMAMTGAGIGALIYGRALRKVSGAIGVFRSLLRWGAKQLDVIRNGALDGAKAARAFAARWTSAGTGSARAIGSIASAVTGKLAGSISNAARAATSLATGVDFRSLATNIKNAVAPIPGLLRKALNPANLRFAARGVFDFDALLRALPVLKIAMSNAFNNAKQLARIALFDIVSTAETAFGRVASAVRARMGSVGSSITSRLSSALAPVGAVMQRAFAPITARVAPIFNQIGTAAVGVFRRVVPLWSADLRKMLQVGRGTFRLIGAAWKATWPKVAGAFVNVMRGAFNRVSKMGRATGRVIASGLRGSLGRGLGAVSGGIGGLGSMVGMLGTGAAAGLGATISMIPMALGLLGSLAAAFAFLLSPIGLVAAAIAGGAVLWVRYSEAGKQAFEKIKNAFAPLIENVKSVINGVRDALMGGDLGLAAEIAWTGLKIAFHRGMNALMDIIDAIMSGDLKNAFASGMQAVPGEFKGILGTVQDLFGGLIDRLGAMWAAFSEGVIKMWANVANSVMDMWENTVGNIGNTILEQAAKGGALGGAISKMLGVDISQEQAKRELLHRKQAALAKRELADAQEAVRAAEESGDAEALKFARTRVKNAEASLANANDVPDLLSEAQADIARQLENRTKGIRAELETLKREAERRTEDAYENLPDKGDDKAAREDRIAQLEAELARLNALAAASRKKAEKKDEEEAGEGAGEGALAGTPGAVGARASIATFSSAALTALGQSGGAGTPQEEMKKTWAEQRRFFIEARRERQKEAAEMKKLVAEAIAAVMVG